MDITYQSLAEFARDYSYTDHILHFRHLFDNLKVEGFLEWGCGYSTKIFLENSKHVISVELITSDSENQTEWMNQCVKLFGEQPNWTPVLEVCTQKMHAACVYQSSKHRDYALIDPGYVEELDAYIKNILAQREITISLVDAGVYIRGDLVELSLQNKIPIVIAHDTANSFPDYPDLTERVVDKGLYGWFKVRKHDDYEKIFVDHGCGTTFWIRKDYPLVIAAMNQYNGK